MYIQETENSRYIPYFIAIQRVIQLPVHVHPGNGRLALHSILYSHTIRIIQLLIHEHPGNGKPTFRSVYFTDITTLLLVHVHQGNGKLTL